MIGVVWCGLFLAYSGFLFRCFKKGLNKQLLTYYKYHCYLNCDENKVVVKFEKSIFEEILYCFDTFNKSFPPLLCYNNNFTFDKKKPQNCSKPYF